MTILYALVARGKTVLSEFTFTSGNFPTITRLLLGRIDMARSGKMSYIYDQYVFHYVCEGLLYLCMCDDPDSQKRRVPFAFLEDVKRRFLAAYGDVAQTAIAFAMNLEFSRVLQQQMELFNGPMGDRQQFNAVHQKLDDVKNVMVQNIEMVLERGEKLELLVDKTDRSTRRPSPSRRARASSRRPCSGRRSSSTCSPSGSWASSSSSSRVACGADFGKCRDDDGSSNSK
ncbi:SNAP receptor [Aureococcus anophagefferens]|nr:SNAP receptor [Aureococcus anophagefferens]